MNILMLTSTYPEPDDGTTKATYTVQYFCEQWVKQGHQVVVIHNSSKFPLLFYFAGMIFGGKLSSKLGYNMPTFRSRTRIAREENGVRIFRMPLFKVIPHSRFSSLQINKQFEKIKRIIKNDNFCPDIVMSHWLNPQIDLIDKFKNQLGVRTSIVFHESMSMQIIRNHKIYSKIMNVDAIGCRSAFEAKKTMELLNLTKKPFVCCSGIPDEYVSFQLGDSIRKEFQDRYIYVGRLIARKNIDITIKALCQEYPNKDFEFTIVGEGSEKENLKKLVSELGVEKNIIFQGAVERNVAFDLLSKSDCFIMASTNEVYGMAYIESMLAGCVTIGTLNGGCDGIIINDNNGFLVKDKSVSDLRNTISEIRKKSSREIYQLRKKARDTASNMTDYRVAETYLNDALTW